jgi:hypothetical protein
MRGATSNKQRFEKKKRKEEVVYHDLLRWWIC